MYGNGGDVHHPGPEIIFGRQFDSSCFDYPTSIIVGESIEVVGRPTGTLLHARGRNVVLGACGRCWSVVNERLTGGLW